MERTKKQIIKDIEEINDEIEAMIDDQYKAMNSRYQELTGKLRGLLKELDEVEGRKHNV